MYHMEFKDTLKNLRNYESRLVTHLAALLNAPKCLKLFIKSFKVSMSSKDIYGKAAQDYQIKQAHW